MEIEIKSGGKVKIITCEIDKAQRVIDTLKQQNFLYNPTRSEAKLFFALEGYEDEY